MSRQLFPLESVEKLFNLVRKEPELDFETAISQISTEQPPVAPGDQVEYYYSLEDMQECFEKAHLAGIPTGEYKFRKFADFFRNFKPTMRQENFI